MSALRIQERPALLGSIESDEDDFFFQVVHGMANKIEKATAKLSFLDDYLLD